MGRMGKKIIDSTLVKLGSDPQTHHGSLSDPIYKTSTIIFNNYKEFFNAKKNKFSVPYYGRFGNYTSKRFEKVVCKIYGSESSVITSSGLSAITISLLTFLESGDELLVSENCYEPVFNFCSNELKKFGVKTNFFKNNKISLFKKLVNSKTKVIYLESPGSLNYAVEDIDKIIKIAKANNITTIIDNTWATFLGFNPLKWGIDIAIESCTKYFSGHSDNFCGIIACSQKNFKQIKQTAVRLGDFVSPESCYIAIRGMRTLRVRLRNHQENALKVFKFLKKNKTVKNIFFLPDIDNQYHKLWRKYFSSANGLITFSIIKKNTIESFVDSLELLKIGFSWGGYESLILPINKIKPTIKNYKNELYWFRIHVGLESSFDIIKDLEKGFRSYEK